MDDVRDPRRTGVTARRGRPWPSVSGLCPVVPRSSAVRRRPARPPSAQAAPACLVSCSSGAETVPLARVRARSRPARPGSPVTAAGRADHRDPCRARSRSSVRTERRRPVRPAWRARPPPAPGRRGGRTDWTGRPVAAWHPPSRRGERCAGQASPAPRRAGGAPPPCSSQRRSRNRASVARPGGSDRRLPRCAVRRGRARRRLREPGAPAGIHRTVARHRPAGPRMRYRSQPGARRPAGDPDP